MTKGLSLHHAQRPLLRGHAPGAGDTGCCRGVALALALSAAACSPTLDWREVRPAASSASLLMPCRPSAQTRAVVLAGQTAQLVLHACSAGGQTWALAFADVVDPARVGMAMSELLSYAAANVGAASAPAIALAVPGATPHAASAQMRLAGHLPDGRAVAEAVAVFPHGTVVYQATALGEQLPEEAVQVFIGSLRVGR